ncbi:hypothetical protein H4R18_003354 [Coemansia javaensis]|uniref:Uncharacterized protein n=1 Tax=Coemansia javaensis TaxID=2761396 RepID=A0A9W8HFM1_9FUNG|nr:hypothetical protein H4R18_003354 [Coemansia javaensis]
MKLAAAVAASALALGLAGPAAAYDIVHSASLNCRKQPTTKSDKVKMYILGDDIEIVCQTEGETVFGTNIWDATQDGCFVLDYYLYTGMGSIFKPLCNNSPDGKSVLPVPAQDGSSINSSSSTKTGTKTDAKSDTKTDTKTDAKPSSSSESESSDLVSTETDSEPSDTSDSSAASVLAGKPAAALVGAAIALAAAFF